MNTVFTHFSRLNYLKLVVFAAVLVLFSSRLTFGQVLDSDSQSSFCRSIPPVSTPTRNGEGSARMIHTNKASNLWVIHNQYLTSGLTATLNRMVTDVELRLSNFAADENYQKILNTVFASSSPDKTQFSDKCKDLRARILSRKLNIKIEVRSNQELKGHPAVYAAHSCDGSERIYINQYWLSSGLMYDYLANDVLHELGHAFNQRLNGGKSNGGEVGEYFSRALNNEVFTNESLAAIKSEDGIAVLNIDGHDLSVECATVSFLKVYADNSSYVYTTNSSSISIGTPIQGGSFKFTSANPADVTFSGNNVAGQLSYISGGLSYTINGLISRKVGSSATAFYFVETTVLGGAVTTGNAWLLIVPGNEGSFTDNNPDVKTNSAPSTGDLNTFLSTQTSNVAPAITSNGGGATASVSVAENTAAVTTVTATDANSGDTKTFSISGGADAAKFTINASTGVLSFISAPDFENPTDAGLNNVYDVQVTVTDSQGATDKQDIAVNVTNVNDNVPVITSNGGGSTATIPVTQGSTTVTTVKATDADAGDVLTYTISGGTNSGLFAINSSSGALSFNSSAVNGSYNVIVQVSDGTHTDTQTATVNVTTTDVTPPTLTITSSDNNLAAGETCTLYFQFSEPVTGFIAGDIGFTGGSLSGFAQSLSDPTLYTAQFTQSGSSAAPSFSVAANSYQDLAASPNNGVAASLTLSYDVVAPTVTVTTVNSQMAYGESQIVTFTFSENPGISFTADDLTVTNGTLTNLLQSATPTVWTASLKATNSTSGPTVTVKGNSYSDPAGNQGSSGSVSLTLAAPSIGLASTSSSDSGSSLSDNITSNRKPVIVGLAPANTNITVTVTAGSTYTYTVSVPSNGSWSLDLSSVTGSPALPSSGLPEGYVGLNITTSGSATASSSFLIDVTAPATPAVNSLTTASTTPTITGTATVGDTDLFTVTIGGVTYTNGDGNLSYNISAHTWTLTVPTALSAGSYQVTASVKDLAGNNSSNSSSNDLVICLPPSVSNQPSAPATVNSGAGTATICVTASGNNLSYQWYVDGSTPLTNTAPYSGVTTSTLTITNPLSTLNNKQYYVIVTGTGGTATSNSATLTVNTVTAGSISGTQSIAYQGDPVAFTESSASAGNGTLTYKWQLSTTSATSGFSDISGATSTTYDPPSGLTQNTWYKRITTSTYNSAVCSSESNVIQVSILKTFNVGASTTDWNNPANWLPSGVPTSSDNIYIPSPVTVTINLSEATCNNITIQSGAAIVIPSGKAFTVNGTLTNNSTGGIVIQSDATGTGSLIAGAVAGTGSATAQCYMVSSRWHILSSSLTGEDVSEFLPANTNVPDRSSGRAMMDYDPVNNVWNNYFTNTTNGITLGSGKGYMVRVNNDSPVTYKGNIMVGNQTVTGLVSGKWNCIGNPYTSAIGIRQGSSSIDDFLDVNSSNLDPSFGAIYIWDKDDSSNGKPNQYTITSNANFGQNKEVQQGQGFMVRMNSSATSINFTPAMQFHNSSLAYKSAEKVWPTIKLIAAINDQKSSTIIAFNSSMTKGLDPTYDAGLLKSGADLCLYTQLVQDNGIPFAIQALPDNDFDNTVIPVGLDYKTGGEVTFSAENLNLPSNCKVVLEDKLTGSYTDLSVNQYKTTVAANSSTISRFLLHTSNVAALPGKALNNTLNAYANRNIDLRVTGNVSKYAIATLYDIHGRVALSKNLEEGDANIIPLPKIKSGIYLLSINDNGKIKGFKILIGE